VELEEDFEGRPIRQSDELTLSLDGWEGPLDLLLSLARAQKVDLAQISILQLVEQYLTYLAEARALKLEIAADYLVMAAWLAYLKSCLLLPKDPEQDPSPEEIAFRLQLRLQRLDAMREAGARLLGRDRIGRDVFLRGPCVMCHTIQGTPAGSHVGPDLTHVGSRMTIAAATLPNTRGHLAGWIANSQSVKPGNRMPPNALTPEDLQAVLSYVRSLR